MIPLPEIGRIFQSDILVLVAAAYVIAGGYTLLYVVCNYTKSVRNNYASGGLLSMASKGKVATNEEMQEFSDNCALKDKRTGQCLHQKQKEGINHCLVEKKFCPRVSFKTIRHEDLPEWKKDYAVFKAEHDRFFEAVILSEKFIKPLQIQYPSIDVTETLILDSKWWSSDSPKKGYENKRKGAGKTIDWETTYTFALRRSIYMKQAVKKNTGNSMTW